MPDPSIDPTSPEALSLLERRLIAALCDATIVGLCCLGLFVARSGLVPPHPGLWLPSLLVFGVVSLVEIGSGITPGKAIYGLSIIDSSGKRPPMWAVIVRGVVRLLPAFLFAGSVSLPDPAIRLLGLGLALTLLLCYVAASYLMMMRVGRTMFDSIARTTLVRRR